MDSSFDMAFEPFGSNNNMMMAANGQQYQAHPDFTPIQMKAAQTLMPNNNDNMASGAFFLNNFDVSTFAPGYTDMPRMPVKSDSSPFQDFVAENASPPMSEGNLNMDSAVEVDFTDAKAGSPRSRSDGSLSQAQSRRKAQNRAAQRAFRERKERHVRELEAQLSTLNEKATTLQSSNERLINLLKQVQAENKILKTRSARQSRSGSMSQNERNSPEGTSRSSSRQSTRDTSPPGLSSPGSTESVASQTFSECLDPVATWNLLQAHPLYIKGELDIGQVCEKLKGLTRCDSWIGPVFDPLDITKAINEVTQSAAAA